MGRVVVSRQEVSSTEGPLKGPLIGSLKGPLIGITSSRLGHDPRLQKRVCQFLTRSLSQCRQRGGTLLVAAGSAIEPWARRASELYSVPIEILSVDSDSRDSGAQDSGAQDSGSQCQATAASEPVGPGRHAVQRPVVVRSDCGRKLSRDAVLIALADRVDAVYVRRGGAIEQCLNVRLRDLKDASTRVAVSMTGKCAAERLIANGAIGWIGKDEISSDLELPPTGPSTIRSSDDAWTRTDGSWLVHCTRGCHGAWPSETWRQYRDSMLLGGRPSAQRGPLDALLRIIGSGRLCVGSGATRHTHPVVCFSAVPLRELLGRRCFRPHLGRWDYEPYGIAIRIEAAVKLGIQPVVYGCSSDRNSLPRAQRYRFHPLGNTYDWTSEREWRSPSTIDLLKLDWRDVRVFVRCSSDAANLPSYCRWPVTTLGDR